MDSIEPSSQLIPAGARFQSPGGRFAYRVEGPICRLYDRAELPWPSCSLVWRGKQPSWNRQGVRFVADLACGRSPSYRVTGADCQGNTWQEDRTLYDEPLTKELRQWWITKKPQAKAWPELPGGSLTR